MRLTRICALAVLSIGTAGGAALAEDGDVKKGAKVFKKCKACHVVDEEKNRVGPHLVGIFGREAGSVEGFKYSDAMKEADIVWDDETLTEYLTKPKDFLPGNKMAFAGLRKEKDIVNLLAYLHEETGGSDEAEAEEEEKEEEATN